MRLSLRAHALAAWCDRWGCCARAVCAGAVVLLELVLVIIICICCRRRAAKLGGKDQPLVASNAVRSRLRPQLRIAAS